MTSIERLYQVIATCEARLNDEEYAREEDNNDFTVFPGSSRVLYHQLLGSAYLQLVKNGKVSSGGAIDVNYKRKCLLVLEEGMNIAAEYLQIVDPIRLLIAFNYCDALCFIKQKHHKAKLVAERVVELASSHLNDISDSAITTLQHLRDHFMTYGTEPELKIQDDHSVQEEHEEDQQEINEMFAVRKRSVKFKEIDSIRSQRMATISSPGVSKRLMVARNLRKTVSLPVPVLLESITSAAHILKALDKSFRAYIRGNALPGQLSGGATVDLAGQTMTFRTFVLQGPYMSWKGFVSFLLDFNIAALPSNKTRSGKSFYRTMRSPALEKSLETIANRPGPDPLLEMTEAAMIFMESSQSATPALVMNKFLKLYQEIANNITSDPWNNVYDWAESHKNNEWDIQYGLNFMQFVDCLGKLGIIAYSVGRFNEMLPTVNDKIEHFFSAYLGFADQRRWHTKVDTKLKAAKKIIQQLTQSKEGQQFGKSHRSQSASKLRSPS